MTGRSRSFRCKLALWLIVVLTTTGVAQSKDLLTEAREWRQRDGLVAARDKLLTAVMREDSSRGTFERKIWKTNADKSYVWPDAAERCTPAERARTGIFVVLGYRQHSGRAQRLVRDVVKRLQADGWNAHLIELPEWSLPSEDIKQIHETMRRELPRVDRAILVGFSKGGWDWINWFHGPAAKLPLQQRDKIRLLVDFAAILRGSSVAGWAADHHGTEASLMRLLLVARFGAKGATPLFLRRLAHDPWDAERPRLLRAVARRLSTIEYVAIPEGRDGYTHTNGFFAWVNRSATRAQPSMGPNDGMAESAAQLLPSGERVPKWVVRVAGSHALLDGRYINGNLVSRRYRSSGPARWTAGEELMDDLLRALPRSAIGW
ncbi:MAG: hypothetical protein ACXWFY_02555 [Chthoniobacterales bacterium]